MIKSKISKDLLKVVEEKHLKQINNIQVGDIIRLAYIIPEGNKERTQFYEGVIICIKNRSLSKSFTIRKTIDGVGVEQNFPAHSPRIASINIKQNSEIRRSKLYFIRKLSGKAAKLKLKRKVVSKSKQ